MNKSKVKYVTCEPLSRWSWPTFSPVWKSWSPTPTNMSNLRSPRWVRDIMSVGELACQSVRSSYLFDFIFIFLRLRWSWVWAQSLARRTQLSTFSLSSSHNWKMNVQRWTIAVSPRWPNNYLTSLTKKQVSHLADQTIISPNWHIFNCNALLGAVEYHLQPRLCQWGKLLD